MNVLPEKRSSGLLFSYIDLLFLLVCFFILLLFYAGKETQTQQETISQMTQQLAESAEEYDLAQKTISQLKPLAKTALELLEKKKKEEEIERERQERFRKKTMKRISYYVTQEGYVTYKDQSYTPQEMLEEIVSPLREQYWIALRSYAPGDVAFGQVIGVRRILLSNRGEFDSFWSNLESTEK